MRNNDKDVYPIRDKKKIDTLKKYLYGNPRNHLLFVLGINSGIRMSDLLNLRVGDVSTKVEGEKVVLKESKTGKRNFFVVNSEIQKSLSRYLSDNNTISPNNYLFRSRNVSDQDK